MFDYKIEPYKGIGNFKFYQTLENAKAEFIGKGINYNIEIWPNSGHTPEVPWQIIRVKDAFSLFFANEKLFKIVLEGNYKGCLPNNVQIGTSLTEAMKLDKTITFNDWDECYESELGYWFEDNLDDGTIMSISIFIEEILNEDTFFSYEWCQKNA